MTRARDLADGKFANNVTMTSDDPTITMTDSSGTNDIVTIQATSGALIITARDGSADGEIIFKKTDGSATDETLRITNTGRVGIGTSSPAVEAHIQTSSGNPELRIESTGANYATMSVKNSSRHYSTQIRTDQSNAYVVRDETAGANRFSIATSGNVGIGTASGDRKFEVHDTGVVVANFKSTGANSLMAFDNSSDASQNHLIGFSGDDFRVVETTEKIRVLSSGGITFNGDNTTSNALDDYEEGTFTPSFISGATGITYTERSGRYTKIGNMVHFQIFLNVNASTTNSGGVQIGGLPFTSFNGQPLPSYSIGYNNNFHGGSHTLTALGNSNTTTISLYQDDGSQLTGSESNFGNDLYISGSYIAA
jgi:hypothetical protein